MLAAAPTQIVGRSVDDFTVGFPTAAVLDGRTALLAVGMNGEPLPVKHGFPARLVIAGLYGYVSATKWVTELEATTFAAYDAYWVPRGWAQKAPIKTESRIDVPRDGRSLQGRCRSPGWPGHRHAGSSAVEVQVDDGSWRRAQLAPAISKETWRSGCTGGTRRGHPRAAGPRDRRRPAPRRPRPTLRRPPDGATGYHTVVVESVVEVNHAVAETAFVQQLELQADVVGEGPVAASHHDRRDEQVALVDQPGPDRLGGEVGTAHGDVTSR